MTTIAECSNLNGLVLHWEEYSTGRFGLDLQLFLIWYFVIGFLLGNGVPHFVFGAAGKIFRSPFGQRSPPRTNIIWGLSNFVAASIISLGLTVYDLYNGYALSLLLLGFWLTILMFGTGIKRFMNE